MVRRETDDIPRLNVSICGKLAIEAGTVVVLERDFPARQGRRLWSYLVLERRRIASRDELGEAIWGDEPPDEWDTALSAIASRLRSTLKPVPGIEVVNDSGGYRLRLPSHVFIDFERARYGLHLAETALAQGDARAALSEARVALEIAARGFLPGEGLPWVELRRRQLRDTQIHAGECLAEAELRRNQPLRAEREAEELLIVDPLNEAAYRIRMRAAVAMGNRAGLLRAITQCRTVLASHAGMTPSAETEQLFQDLGRDV
ncbi:MAG TPA: BTAD domain-containing putative transcriptional regulator [Thermomicrobiales bacterium]|nr:BTAD domain-containing putative transcriptional regulator [Thermomicrobiales bacterium]